MPNPEVFGNRPPVETLPSPALPEVLPQTVYERRYILKAGVTLGSILAAMGATEGVNYISKLYDDLHSDPVKNLESPPHVECKAASTNFYLSTEQVQQVKVRNIGDSLLAGFDGEVAWHPDAEYQVDGMNTNYNDTTIANSNLPVVTWQYENDAVKGTEIWQWAKELEWYEIDRRLKEEYAPEELTMEDAEISSETWQIGTGGNNVFHYALQMRKKLNELFQHPTSTGLINDFAYGLDNTYKEAKIEYKKILELTYFLKRNGYAPHLDRLVLIGMPNPTIMDEVDIEDTNGKQLKIQMDATKRKYAGNAITNMNNTLKEAINEFMSEHPFLDLDILWIDPSEFLKKEDMHDIHPWKTGYWNIARKILDHYVVIEDQTKNQIQLGPIALPDNSPDKPKPEKKVTRRAFIPSLLRAA